MFKQKITASLLHFLASAAIFSIFIAILVFSWFPEPYFTTAGGWQGLKIVALVDLVLGPLLTFVVFNKNKPKSELKRDLGIIVFFQLSALFWGIYTVYLQRPAAIVFWESQFITLPAIEISDIYRHTPMYDRIKKNPRQFYIAKKPITINDINAMLERLKTNKLGPHQQLELYETLEKSQIKLQAFSLDINEITRVNKDMRNQLDVILKNNSLNQDDLLYIPLESKYQNIILLFDLDQRFISFIKAPFKKLSDL